MAWCNGAIGGWGYAYRVTACKDRPNGVVDDLDVTAEAVCAAQLATVSVRRVVRSDRHHNVCVCVCGTLGDSGRGRAGTWRVAGRAWTRL